MKRQRVLVLVHKHLVPPDDNTGIDVVHAEWKTEFDVISTLQENGHEVKALGIQDELNPIRQAIEEVPDVMQLVALSLTPPPEALARLGALRAVIRLDPEALRFTLEEAREFAGGYIEINAETIEALHEQSGGWASGLVLMLEHQRYTRGTRGAPSWDLRKKPA